MKHTSEDSRPLAVKTPASRRGFALLITITLLAFLVLLLVSLSTLTRVETQVAGNSQQLTQARQNALFALNIALGQLQKAAGPDQRVTATAEVLSGTDPTKKKWTGVWDTRTTPTNLTATAPVWLVSQASTTTAPDNTTAAPTLAATAPSSATAVRLVGSHSADIDPSVPADAGNEVVVPVQTITSDTVPGFPAGTPIGRYGYWVGDEGVKARVNLPDPYATKTDTLSLLNRLGTSQRTAWELFSGPTSPTPAATDPATLLTTAMTAASGAMLSPQQLKLLASADSSAPSGAADALAKITTARFHDYTLWSAGVQADVKNGGLKWDLSTAFDLSDTLFAKTEFSGNAPQTRDPNTNVILSPIKAFTPNSGVTAPSVSFIFLPQVQFGSANLYLRGPTWNLLRSHYQLYQTQNPTSAPAAITVRGLYPGGNRAGPTGQGAIPSLFEINAAYSGGTTDPNLNINTSASPPNVPLVPRVTQEQLVPYINRIFIRFGIKTVGPKTVTASDGSTASVYAVQLVLSPIVVLHNPFNTSVVFRNYSGKKYSFASGLSSKVAGQINLFAGTSFGLPLFTRVIVGNNDYMSGIGALGSNRGTPLLGLGANNYKDGKPDFSLLIPDGLTLNPGELKVLYPQPPANGQPDSIIISGNTPPTLAVTDSTYILMGTQTNQFGGFVFPLINGERKAYTPYLPQPFSTNTSVNPPWFDALGNSNVTAPNTALTLAEYNKAVSDAVAAATAATAAAVAANPHAAPVIPGSAAEIWCNAGDNIQVIMNTDSADFEIKYSVESIDPVSPLGSPTPDDAAQGDTASTLAYQLDGVAPDYLQQSGGSIPALNTYLAQYTNYSTNSSSFTRADDYKRPNSVPIKAGTYSTTQYFFGIDYYVKAADHRATNASRPFITSNPVAFEQFSSALGNQTPAAGGKGTSGFPRIMPAYQLDFVDLDPRTTGDLPSNMALNSSNNPIWGPHNGNNGVLISTLDSSSAGLSTIPLINLPSRPLTSLADLQNANIASFGYQPYFAVGNSYACPYVPVNAAVNPVGYGSTGTGVAPTNPYFLYDLSYLMNWALSDKYFFSSLAQEYTGSAWATGDTNFLASIKTWAAGTRTLPNSRNIPYNATRATATTNLAASATNLQSDYRQVAASLLTLGSFNINSRSIDAWAAILGAARGLSVISNSGGSLNTLTTPVTSTPVSRLLPASSTQGDSSTLSAATWNGFTALTDAQIRQFAKNIVAEITRRQNGSTFTMTGTTPASTSNPGPAIVSYTGPFRSLSDFINRNLTNDLSSGATSTGAKGALQAALDDSTNANSPNYKFYTGSTYQDVSTSQGDSKWAFNWTGGGGSNANAGAGPTTSTALGFILQGDVLQQIGPYLSARSDTFVIRTYGESLNPATGDSAAKAWCEVVVQRTPEYIDQTDSDLTKISLSPLGVALYDATPPHSIDAYGAQTDNLSTLNKTFGRRFKIISFRWLSPQDI